MDDRQLRQHNELYILRQKQNLENAEFELKKWIKYANNLLLKISEEKKVSYEQVIASYTYTGNQTDIETLLQCSITENATSYFETYSNTENCFYSKIKDFLKASLEFKHLQYVFGFGRYNGRYVKEILTEDREYCVWFRDNIIGDNFEQLQLIDYICKTINNIPYYTKKQEWIELQQIISDYVPLEWHKYIDNEKILNLTVNKGSSFEKSSLIGNDYDSWEYEVYNYEDLC